MTDDSSLPLLVAHLANNNDFMKNGDEVKATFQLLRQEDLYMSMAWHSIWHELESIR